MRDVKVIESSELTWYKCNGSGHVRRKCPTYLRLKGKAMNATFSDSDSSTSQEGSDDEGNFIAFTSKIDC